MATSQAVGLVLAVAAVVVSGEGTPGLASLGWAAVAGLTGLGGVACFYRALASGEMSLAAPLTAVIGAGLPATIGLLAGERLQPGQLLGLACGLAAVMVVSWSSQDPAAEARSRQTARSLPLVILAGLGFAGFFLGIGQATDAAAGGIWWPLLAARLTTVLVAVAVVAILAAGGRRQARARPAPAAARRASRAGVWALPAAALGLIGLAGLGDFGGNGFFLLANADGAFSLAVILSSLYPVATVILAGALLGERLRPFQLVGVGLAIAGVLLIAL